LGLSGVSCGVNQPLGVLRQPTVPAILRVCLAPHVRAGLVGSALGWRI